MTPFWKTGVKFWLWLAVFAVAGFVLGSRLWLVRTYGSDVPYMDQWDAQAKCLYQAQAEGRLSLADFWAPHNEHRLVFTKALGYGLTYGNGQWDPLLEMTVNAALYAGLAALLVAWAWWQLGAPAQRERTFAWAACAVAIAALFSLPMTWENILQGFQSQFVLATLAAVGAIWLAAPASALGKRWWAGVGVGAIGLLTMASGFFSLAALLVVVGIRLLWCERRWTWRDLVGAAVLVALCAVGTSLVRYLPGSDHLRAPSFGAGVHAFLSSLAWPAYSWVGWAALLQAPSLLLASRVLWQRKLEARDAVLLGIVAWCWLQLAATAYARGNHMMVLASRYLDMNVLLLVANVGAAARLWQDCTHRWLRPLLALSALVLVYGLRHLSLETWAFLDGLPAQRASERAHLRAFVDSGDLAVLRNAPAAELPHPHAELLADCLTHPGVRTLLSAGLRPAISLAGEPPSQGFTQGRAQPSASAPDRLVWQSTGGPARFVSEPLPEKILPVLRLAFRGGETLSPAIMRLEAADGTRVPLGIRRFAGDRWQTAHLQVPAGHGSVRFVVELPAGSPAFAFANPVELGRWSWYANHVRKAAGPIRWLSILVGSLALWMLTRGCGRSALQRMAGWFSYSRPSSSSGSFSKQAGTMYSGGAFVLWAAGGAMVLFLAATPLLWPNAFSTPLPTSSWQIWGTRLLLFSAIPLSVCGLFRTYPGEKREKWAFVILALLGAGFCEQIVHQFVDKGHYFNEVNDTWQRSLQARVLALDPNFVPHSYRFLSHGLVELFSWFGGSFEVGRAAYRLLFNALLYGAILRYARLFLPAVYAGATLVLLLCLYPITVAWFAGQFVDPVSHLSFVACLYFLQRGFEPGMGPAIGVGVFAKESVVVMAAARFFYPRMDRRSLLAAVGYGALAVAGLLAIRLWVNHGTMQYRNISGVGWGHLWDNLKGWDEWVPQYLFSIGVLIPGAVFGWRLMDRRFQLTTLLLGATLIGTSAFFSWLNEVRNLFPAMIMLAIVNLRYVQSRISPDTPAQ